MAHRCSDWTRDQAVDPIGTAGSWRAVLLIEWPLPWPRDIAEIPDLAPVAAAAKEAGCRLQGLVCSTASRGHVALYGWEPTQGRYDGMHVDAGPHQVEVALKLLAGDLSPTSAPIRTTELLVCGHGRRDRCCGSLGTSLARWFEEKLGLDLTVWRTSHLGGHRFAPTALVLPEGTSWGYLDGASALAVATRSGPAQRHLWQYRGCTGLGSPGVQALERSALAEVGWDLLDWSRHGLETGDGLVELRAQTPDGEFRGWRGKIVTKRLLPVPQCGTPIRKDLKLEAELEIEELETIQDK